MKVLNTGRRHRKGSPFLPAFVIAAVAGATGVSFFITPEPTRSAASRLPQLDNIDAELSEAEALGKARKFDEGLSILGALQTRTLTLSPEARERLDALSRALRRDQKLLIARLAYDSGDMPGAMLAAEEALNAEPGHAAAAKLFAQAREALREENDPKDTRATLWVRSQPPGMVFFDRRAIGMSPQRVRAAPGRHSVEILQEGFHAVSRDLTLRRGESSVSEFTLAPLTPGDRPAVSELAPPIYEGESDPLPPGVEIRQAKIDSDER
jgi:hypothetical protein